MPNVNSRDGTRIAFSRDGSGPPILLVDGALCYRGMGPAEPLAALLTPSFTVYTYDRRGRGESGDTAPWSVEREVEDIAAVISEAGGSVNLYGISSGAALALEAANTFPAMIRKLAVYEAPFIVDDSRDAIPDDYLSRLHTLLAENDRGAMLKMFMKFVGMPSVMLLVMPLFPAWKKLKQVAHTLVNDIAIVQRNQKGRPIRAEQWSAVTMPTLAADGGKSPTWMRNGMKAVTAALPNATYRTLDGQTHMLNPKAIAPVLVQFFQ